MNAYTIKISPNKLIITTMGTINYNKPTKPSLINFVHADARE